MYRAKTGHAGRKAARSEGLFCNYSHRICMQDRYEGSEYCLAHILEDKSAPFKQCNFVSTKTGQKCQKAAPKADRREGYCPAHARKAALMRHKAALKAKPTDPVRDTLEELDYYRPDSSRSVPEVPPSIATKILDYGSESESEGDPLLLEQAWRGTTDSDAESVDSEQEDALKYAGVYTAEEAALITKDKLIRLQSLYINQFKRLQHIMREKRRSYLVALGKEREAFGIDFGVITDPKQKRKFKEYQAARGFRRRKGKEALLYLKSKKRRVESTPDYQGKKKVPLMLQCCYKSTDNEQCSKFSLPLAKYCKDHILNDAKQVLYTECAKGEGLCDKPASFLSPDESCPIHMNLPEHVSYKPYEPEPPPPPPPPPKPTPRPPTIIRLPEPILPPAPILPSLLDSQIDQLLQFQPHFLEQQLQQHVYDASQCMGDTQPPDLDVPAPIDAQPASGGGGKDLSLLQAHAGIPMEVEETVPKEGSSGDHLQEKGQKQFGSQIEVQAEVHVNVESDGDFLPVNASLSNEKGQPTADPPVGEVSSAAKLQTSVSDKTSSAIRERTDSLQSSKTEQTKPANEQILLVDPVSEAVDHQEKQTDKNTKEEMAGPSGDNIDLGTKPQSPSQAQPKVPADTQPSHGQQHLDKVDKTISPQTTSRMISAQRATSDHNYNQRPLDTTETSEPIIDVT